jgi:hypothetical protein
MPWGTPLGVPLPFSTDSESYITREWQVYPLGIPLIILVYNSWCTYSTTKTSEIYELQLPPGSYAIACLAKKIKSSQDSSTSSWLQLEKK